MHICCCPDEQVVYAVGNDRQTLEIPEGPLGKLIAGILLKAVFL